MSVRYDLGADGVAVLTLDAPGRSATTMDAAYRAAMTEAIDRLRAPDVTGVVITSAKRSFLAGADLDELLDAAAQPAATVAEQVAAVHRQLRALETLGKPVVAALNGSALGGGLELALACHHRIAVDDPHLRIGFPEVTLGLMPAAGGTARTVRMLGLADALTKLLLRGQRLTATQALDLGLISELTDPASLLDTARRWIAEHPDAAQPWDVPGFRIPGGSPSTPALAAQLPAFPANLTKQLHGAPYPAPHAILAAAVEGAQVDLDTAALIETRYFVDLVRGRTARNMIGALHHDLNRLNSPTTTTTPPPRRAAVIGAGMMGAGIAHALATAGIETAIQDVDPAAATRGRQAVADLLDRAVKRGRLTDRQRDDTLARITTAPDSTGCDLVIEAVFEDAELKKRVLAEAERQAAPGALICSNTSTLPITTLGTALGAPDRFCGLHFFSPVHRMPLVETIRGEATSPETIDRALALVRLLRKTPIVVRDSRGFYTSRVIGAFLNEGVAMLAEGVHPATVEQATLQAGYPTGVLALLDELTLTLPLRIRDEARAAGDWHPHPADAVLDAMVHTHQRPGRAAGAGFYDYDPQTNRRLGLWPGLADAFPPAAAPADLHTLSHRLLRTEAEEAARCRAEGIVATDEEANVGAILGIGYPAWTGGPLRYLADRA